MIKQNWAVTDSERERILKLHESATKNQYLLNEQWIDNTKDMKKTERDYKKNPEAIDKEFENSVVPRMGEIPKNIEFGFPLRGSKKGFSLTCQTDDKENVSCLWKGDLYKLPTVQEIGIPKFLPFEESYLQGVQEWEWINELNDSMASPRTAQDPYIYIPAYGKDDLSLHWLRYELLTTKKIKKLQQTTEYIQADDNKYVSENGINYVVGGEDLPTGGRIPVPSEPKKPEPIPPKETPKETPVDLNIDNPFLFDQTILTPEGQTQFDSFVEKLKKYLNYYSGNVEVITSASIDADPEKKAQYNMKLSERRANAIINELKKRLGETSLNFIAKPLGQTDQFAPGLKYPQVKDVNKTAPNRKLIIKLPQIKVKEG